MEHWNSLWVGAHHWNKKSNSIRNMFVLCVCVGNNLNLLRSWFAEKRNCSLCWSYRLRSHCSPNRSFLLNPILDTRIRILSNNQIHDQTSRICLHIHVGCWSNNVFVDELMSFKLLKLDVPWLLTSRTMVVRSSNELQHEQNQTLDLVNRTLTRRPTGSSLQWL